MKLTISKTLPRVKSSTFPKDLLTRYKRESIDSKMVPLKEKNEMAISRPEITWIDSHSDKIKESILKKIVVNNIDKFIELIFDDQSIKYTAKDLIDILGKELDIESLQFVCGEKFEKSINKKDHHNNNEIISMDIKDIKIGKIGVHESIWMNNSLRICSDLCFHFKPIDDVVGFGVKFAIKSS